MRHHHSFDVLCGLHHISTQVPHSWRIIFGALQMKDEDEDLLFSFFFVAFTILIVVFSIVGIGMTIWGLL
jgi:hypothetical protein